MLRSGLAAVLVAGLLSGCGKAILLDVPSDSAVNELVGQKYIVEGPVDLYEIAEPGGNRTPVDFAEIVTGQGYLDPLVRSRRQLPVGTVIEIQEVRLRVIPFETAYLLMVSLSPRQTDEGVQVRLDLSGVNTTTGQNLNPAYFK